MKWNCKRLMAMILVAGMCLGLMPQYVMASETQTSDNTSLAEDIDDGYEENEEILEDNDGSLEEDMSSMSDSDEAYEDDISDEEIEDIADDHEATLTEECDLTESDDNGEESELYDEQIAETVSDCNINQTTDEVWSTQGDAYWDSSSSAYVLTENKTWQSGGILYNHQIFEDFSISLDYYTGDSSSCADGIAVAFYSDSGSTLNNGQYLGFSGTNGYAVELDTYYNSDMGDATYNHIALIKNTGSNHLKGTSLSESEDGSWHHLEIEVLQYVVYVYIDGSLKFSYTIEETGYGYIGITAATGTSKAKHQVKNIEVEEMNSYDPEVYDFSYSQDVYSLSLAQTCVTYSLLAYQESILQSEYDYVQSSVNSSSKKALGNLLHKNGYEDIYAYNYDSYKSSYVTFIKNEQTENSISYTIGHRRVNTEEGISDQIVIVFRGTNGDEWYGNFDVTGTSYDSAYDFHYSFQLAVNDAMESLADYISEMAVKGKLDTSNVSILLTGHSRGAAVANMMAHELTDIKNDKTEDYNVDSYVEHIDDFSSYTISSVYAYTFATPNVATYEKINSYSSYNNIFNICFTDDFVPNLPLENWSWGKYGQTYWATAAKLYKNNITFEFATYKYFGKKPSYSETYTNNIVKAAINITAETTNGLANYYCAYDVASNDGVTSLYVYLRSGLGKYMAEERVIDQISGINILTNPIHCWNASQYYKSLAKNFVTGAALIPALNYAHQCGSYYEALFSGCTFSLSELTSTGYNATLYDSGVEAEYDSDEVTAIQIFLNQTFTIDDTTTSNAEQLGWDIDDVSTWDGITWSNGRITAIDISYASVYGELDLNSFSELVELDCCYNNLTDIVLTGCDSLEYLDCSGNALTSLDLSNLSALLTLDCSFNQLTSLVLSECSALETLYCGNNCLTALHLSECLQLSTLYCDYNYLNTNDSEFADLMDSLNESDDGIAVYLPQSTPEDAEFAENDVKKLIAIANTGTNNDVLGWDLDDPSSWEYIEWLQVDNVYYVETISFTDLGLTGTADFSNCEYLSYLLIQDNGFTDLILTDCTALKTIWCSYNYLASETVETLSSDYGDTNLIVSPQLIDQDVLLSEKDVAALNSIVNAMDLDWDSTDYINNESLEWSETDDGTYELTAIDFDGEIITGDVDLSAFEHLTNLMASDSDIESIILPASMTELADHAFSGCDQLSRIEFLGSVTSIGAYSFANCSSLSSIELPDTLVIIGEGAFYGCYNLENIVIPQNITQIEMYAFRKCDSLETVVFEGNAPEIDEWVFYGITLVVCYYSSDEWSELIANTPFVANITWLTLGQGNIESLSLIQHPTKAYYGIDEELDLTGLEVEATYDTGDVSIIPINWLEVSEYDFSTLGTKTISVSYQGFFVSFDVEVTDLDVYAYGSSGDDINWILTGEGELIVKGQGNMTDWSSGSDVDWYGLRSNITTVTIEEGITSIGDYAFYDCSSLVSVSIPDSIIDIGNYVFYGCTGLTEIVIPDNITSIGNSTFYNCTGLSEIVIPEAVNNIGSGAFYNCTGLTNITIPEAVVSIGSGAFYNCTGLTTITIPETVTSIGSYAFYNCKALTGIELPEGITSIEDYLFYNCTGLTSITIPEGVISIGGNVFYNCTGLTTITIPEMVTSIGSYAFYNCKALTGIELPEGITSIEDYLFYNCTGLISITIPKAVVSIGSRAFYNCTALTDITIPETVTSIGSYAFYNCKGLTGIEIPEGITSIEDYVFYNCTSLTDIVIPDAVINIGKYSFYKCTGLADNIVIPDAVTTIGDYAFAGCTAITEIVIPEATVTIGGRVFENCTSLMEVTIPASSGTASITYTYNSSSGTAWGIFNGCTSLTNVTFNEGITWIHAGLFAGSGIKSIVIPDTVTGIGAYAFNNCGNLEEITLSESIESLEKFAFARCTSISEIVIPEATVTIGDSAFENCTSLTDVTIPASSGSASIYYTYNTSSGSAWGIFNGCTSLTNVTFNEGTTWIHAGLFAGSGIKSIVIPDTVTGIGAYAFNNCETLEEITLPESIESIGSNAFAASSSITDVYYGGTEEEWNEISVATGNSYLLNATVHYSEVVLSITGQPEDQCVELGSTATFAITADGDDLTYQWQWSGNSGKTWINSSSATTGYNTDTLKVTATAGRNGYLYRCVVTDGDGNSVTSDAAILTLAEEETDLVITSQPEDLSVELGSTATFTITAEGTGLTYQWQWSGNSGKTWNNSSSATTGYNTNTLKVKMTSGRNGYQYRCVVTDGDGNSVTSDAAILTLAEEEKELAITGQPEDQSVAVGSTATFTVTAEGTGLTYQWQWSGNSGKTWNNSSSATIGYNTNTLKVTMTTGRNGYQYRCVVTDSNGNSVTSDAATLTLPEEDTELSITGQPEDQTVTLGSTANFTVTAEGTGLTYQWQWSGDGGKKWTNSSSATTGYNAATLKVTATAGRNGYMYRCVVTDKNGESLTSDAATLTVASETSLTSEQINQEVLSALEVDETSVIACGIGGESVTWVLTKDGELTISGEGEMDDYSTEVNAPWYGYCAEITSLVAENGVTRIGACAFLECNCLECVVLGDDVAEIGDYAFASCDSITSFVESGSISRKGECAFENNQDLVDILTWYEED